MTLQLYGHRQSAPTRELLILCEELGVEYELVEVNQAEEIYLPEALNPLCKVPMIDDDGFMLAEVHAIGRYLVASRGASERVYPPDPQQRAVADQWLAWQEIRLAPLSAQQLYYQRLNPQLPEAGQVLTDVSATLVQLLPELELALTERVIRDQALSLVTIALGVSFEQLVVGEFSLTAWPAIAQYQQRWSGSAAFNATRAGEFSV